MGSQYTLCRAAVIKLVLHSAKYPHCAVNGALLGTVSPTSDSQSNVVEIVDAVPLFHSYHALAPSLEAALFQVESHAKGQSLTVVGYYHANERSDDSELGAAARRIADTVNNNCPEACALLLDNSEIHSYLQQDGAKICELYTRDRGWNKQLGLKYSDAGVPDILLDFIRDSKHVDLVDFQDHLEDISKDWVNPGLLG
mmetsp:Transcript_15408/g.43095  ORF Transcript_15408/g.43095 Transcript_15408/m.43095 type:complete len:198 (-) Transcript_15408:183-776(-)